MRILVADDDRTSQLIAKAAVRSLGHECHTASDGLQAWDIVQSLRPDVVISDWLMPGLTGLELCRNIRASVLGDYVYFIMVSGQAAPDEVFEGMGAGADDYLVKPLDPDDLRARLIAATRVTSLHRQLGRQRTELQGLNGELTAIARRDPLTGLGNRRALQEDLELLEARVRRYGHRYCMALLDVDHFKSYNDAYGHQAGDEALQVVAAQLQETARSGDAMYRYGGEEFLCVFPEQSLATGTKAVERMRVSLERRAIRHLDNPSGVLTFSAGVAVLAPDCVRPAAEVLKDADEALYRAKQLGRNRVEWVRGIAAKGRSWQATRLGRRDASVDGSDPGGLRMPKVVVVDDDPDLRALLEVRLRRLGYRVLSAGSGEEALHILTERGAPDVAVLDVTMPGMSGMDLLLKLREDPVYRAVPIIFLSARVQPADIDAGKELGAIYLTKPVIVSALIQAIDRALNETSEDAGRW